MPPPKPRNSRGSKRRNQTHGKIIHQLNDREALVWDSTDISPEVKERFDKVVEVRMAANNQILKRLKLARRSKPKADGPPPSGQTA